MGFGWCSGSRIQLYLENWLKESYQNTIFSVSGFNDAQNILERTVCDVEDEMIRG